MHDPANALSGAASSHYGESHVRSLFWPTVETWDLENLRRSIAMLQPGQMSYLKREHALQLLDDVIALQGRLDQLEAELRRLAEQ